jgi:hypothetical protein
MSAQLQQPSEPQQTEPAAKSRRTRDRVIAGIALIAIGIVVLIAQLMNRPELSWIIVPMLGLIFLIWGVAARTIGLIIPGGILSGIGLGLYFMFERTIDTSDEQTAGVLLVCFAGGWVVISLLSLLTREGFQWWPLIPGGIIAVIGLALLGGGVAMQLVKIAGYAWPLILVGVGIYLLLRRRQG